MKMTFCGQEFTVDDIVVDDPRRPNPILLHRWMDREDDVDPEQRWKPSPIQRFFGVLGGELDGMGAK